MKRKHVLFVLFSAKIIPRHVLMLRALKENGWITSVVVWDRIGGDIPYVHYDSLVDNWHTVRLLAPTWSVKLLTKVLPYYRSLLRVKSSLDKVELIVLTHLIHLPLGVFSRTKVVYDAAEMYSIGMSFYFSRFRRIVELCVRFLEGVLVSRLDGIVTVDSKSSWLRNFYRRWNRRVEVIWNVPAHQDDPDSNVVSDLGDLYSGRKVIAFIGNLIREKGLRVAIESAAIVVKRYEDCLFLFIGQMNDDPDEIFRLIRGKRISNNVHFFDQMSYQEMLAHLSHAQIGLALHQQDRIYPYVSAGNGRKFFSYMQAGIPIIGPEFGEVGKAVKMADCGLLVNTESAKDVADAIVKLLANPDKARRLGFNGRRAFVKRFNWEIEKAKFVSFLEQVVEQ